MKSFEPGLTKPTAKFPGENYVFPGAHGKRGKDAEVGGLVSSMLSLLVRP